MLPAIPSPPKEAHGHVLVVSSSPPPPYRFPHLRNPAIFSPPRCPRPFDGSVSPVRNDCSHTRHQEGPTLPRPLTDPFLIHAKRTSSARSFRAIACSSKKMTNGGAVFLFLRCLLSEGIPSDRSLTPPPRYPPANESWAPPKRKAWDLALDETCFFLLDSGTSSCSNAPPLFFRSRAHSFLLTPSVNSKSF